MAWDLSSLTDEERAELQAQLAGETAPAPAPRPGNPHDFAERVFGAAPPPNPAVVQRLPTAQQWVSKQMGNLRAVGEQNYRIGVQHPKKDPIAAGIAAQGRYEAQMSNREVLARREAGLRRTNIDEWVQLAETRGARNLVSGVEDRQYKVERFVDSFQPKLEAHLRTLDALPNVTDADRERRMLENLKGLRALKGGGRAAR